MCPFSFNQLKLFSLRLSFRKIYLGVFSLKAINILCKLSNKTEYRLKYHDTKYWRDECAAHIVHHGIYV